MAIDKKIKEEVDLNTTLTTSDLKYILDVNKKAIEIYIKVDQQNEKILDTFDSFKDIYDNINKELDILKKSEHNIEMLLSMEIKDHQIFQNVLMDLKENSNTADVLLSANHDAHAEINSSLKEFKTSFTDIKINDIQAKDIIKNMENKIEEIEKNMFRLVILLSSTGISTIIGIILALMKK